jgi:acyl-CoA reductase-like NAD-dependent aldehyde dehydrogenase
MVYVRDDLFVGGRWVPASSGERTDLINPATEEVVGTVPVATVKDAREAASAARRAFDEGPWPYVSPRERGAILEKMGQVMQRRRAELTAIDIAEAGRVQALAPVFVDTPIARWMDLMERVLPAFPFIEPMMPLAGGTRMGSGAVGSELAQGVIRREPYGVAVLIPAFNSPLLLSLCKLGPALAAGCTVVLQPSPYTPLSAFVVAEAAEEAGLPPGVLNLVTGSPEVGQQLTTDPNVDMVSFTGSDVVGRKIMSQSSATLKKVVLELGGKSANIICDDADLSLVAPDVVSNFTASCGQGCGLMTRTLVHASLHDELVERICEILKTIKIGDPSDASVNLGPLISEQQRARVEQLVADGVDEGGEMVCGGKRPEHLTRGFFYEPTLFANVKNSMSIAQKEFFGPVGVIVPFADDDEAVRLANESNYGLSGGVWSSNPVRAYNIAQRVRTGTVAINGSLSILNPNAPFGGYKNSGLGREYGRWGIDEYLEYKGIHWAAR